MSRYRDPLSTRLRDAILSLQPTAYWPLDDGNGPLRDIAGGNWNATVTGSPTFGVGAQDPIGRGVTFSGTGQYVTTSGSVPTPAASVSVGCLYRTTDATASARYVLSRAAASNYTWGLRLDASQRAVFDAYQGTTSVHASATVTGATNDGNWHLIVGTFDGTTIRCYRDTATASSTTLTSTWKKDSTAGVQVAAIANGALFPGTGAHAFLITDRVLTAAAVLWLYSIAAGG